MQGTRHKVSGPLTRDVGYKIMNKLIILSVVCLSCITGFMAYAETPPLDAADILTECGTTNVVDASVAAWNTDLDRAAITGRRGTDYVIIIAYRHPESPNYYLKRWAVAEVSYMMTNGGEIWAVGEQEYPAMPTRKDILALCAKGLMDNPEQTLSHWNIKE